MTDISERLRDPQFRKFVAERATEEDRRRFGPLLAAAADRAKRLSLQPKQQLAEDMSQQCDALLYGGAAGGGKSHWLLVHMAIQMLDFPGNRGVIFRRVFPSLLRSIIPRAKAMYVPHWANYNETNHQFTFHNGSILELGTLQRDSDVDNYQGAEYGVVAFEEVTEFLESQVDYFKTRLRAPVAGVRPHLIATTNPGGIGHKWVKKEWVKPPPEDVVGGSSKPFTVWEARPKGEEESETRCFIPATLDDNPLMNERDPRYRNKLKRIKNPKLRKAMENGDWDAIEEIEGALWEAQIIEDGRVYFLPTINRRIMAIDPADGEKTGDGFGVTVAALGENGHAYCEFNEEWSSTPAEMAAQAIQLYRDMGCSKIVIERNHGGKWIPALFRALDPNINVDTVWAGEGKITRAEPISALFYPSDERPALIHLVDNFKDLEDQMTTFTGKPGEPSPDGLDSFVWAMHELMLGIKKKKTKLRYRAR